MRSGVPGLMRWIVSAACGGVAAVSLAAERTWSFPEWEEDTYVFLPACAYDGNRAFARSVQSYPPKFDGRKFGPSPQMIVTDIPKLEPDGSGAIEVTTGDLATPCAGFWFPKARTGVLIFTEQQFAGFNLGYTVRKGEFVLSAPASRSKGYRFCRPHAPTPEKGLALPAGTAFEPRVKELRFAAPDLTAFFETYFRNRKCLLRDERSTIGFTPELIRLVHDRKNADAWREAGATGYWTPELGDNWTPGWTAGLQTAFGMCFTHGSTDALTRSRALRTIDHLVSTQTPSGLYACADMWAGTNVTRRFGLVRSNADALFHLLKFADRMPLRPAWRESARRACDAFALMWRRYGDWGMFVDDRTGELVMGGTASAALVPAALAKAHRLFGDKDYLALAEEAGLSYYRRFVERGISYGGPCEALLAPDSESAAALLESAVTLAEVTHKPEWIARARAAAAYLSSWIVSYRHRFPETSEFGRLGMNTVGAVWANCQNKHAAPGFCTMSGDALARLAKLTGDADYQELFDDVVSCLPQTVATAERPIRCWNGRWSEPGWINERINMSDWEGPDNVGGIFYGPCWCTTAFLLTAADLGLSPAVPDAVRPSLPLVGTEGMGNVTPAACAPFGMVQAGPDTSPDPKRFQFGKAHCGGYQHGDEYVWRFSQTHVSGMGCPASGNIGLLPVTDAAGLPDRGERMLKETEFAYPGRYGVVLANGVRCEVGAGAFKAEYRFTFPKGTRAQLVVDLDWALGEPEPRAEGEPEAVWGRTVKGCACRFDDARKIRGFQRVRMFVEHTLFFAGRFSRDIVGTRMLREADGLRGDTWLLDFGESDGKQLVVTLALSMDGVSEAVRRLDEGPLDGASAWDEWLSRVTLDPSTDVRMRANFEAAMYHLAVQPNRVSGTGDSARYVLFSLWDTFRAAHPLYTILAPERVNGFVNSLLTEYRSRGYLPILSVWGRDTHCMIGHHAVPVIVDAYLKGFRGFDEKTAGEAIRDSLTVDHVPESTSTWGFTKEDWQLYDAYGYYPHELLRKRFRGQTLCGESVSRTLECAYDDACAARFFRATGDATNAVFFARRAGYWKNVFDPQTGFMRGRDSRGNWRTPFDPGDIGYGPWAERDFTEGNSYQYTWHVMQDPNGLVAAMGGVRAAGEKLDRLFRTKAKERSYDVSGLIGQYAHGNEVSHHIAYFYAFTDRPWRTAEVVREVFDTQYEPHPAGLCGNDDCGQMSAWYLFSAMGFYPFDPCGGEYVLGAPQVPAAQVKVKGEDGQWKLFTMTARGLSKDNKYVKTVTLNGRPVADWKIRHADIVRGGELVFEMCAKP